MLCRLPRSMCHVRYSAHCNFQASSSGQAVSIPGPSVKGAWPVLLLTRTAVGLSHCISHRVSG